MAGRFCCVHNIKGPQGIENATDRRFRHSTLFPNLIKKRWLAWGNEKWNNI